MALAATTKLDRQPSSTTRPVDGSFTFTVTVVDRDATAPTSRTLKLVLSDENDLVFDDNTKVFSQNEDVGKDPVPVTFKARIKGAADDTSSFSVALAAKNSANLPFCLIRVTKS
jgi:hypothetical protein